MKHKCPRCGNVFSESRVRYGDWIKNKEEYEKFWENIPVSAKLAIEDYLALKGQDMDKYDLSFTTKHNEADWFTVKKALQELVKRGLIYN